MDNPRAYSKVFITQSLWSKGDKQILFRFWPNHKLSAIKGFYDRCLFKLLTHVAKEKKELTIRKGIRENKEARKGEQVDSSGDKESGQIS